MIGITSTYVKRSGNFRKLSEDIQKDTLKGMARVAISASPVDTSAYVDSFGFNNPTGFSSKGRQKSQDAGAAKNRNLQRLEQEVEGINLSGPVVFSNTAPHAGAVEDKWGYKVFAQVRREFTNLQT
jgi:hypothetical protein